MRPYDIDYDEFDEFGYGGIEAIRRVTKERRQLEQRLEGRKRPGHARKDPWNDSYWGRFNDYNEKDFDGFSGVSRGHH